MNEAKLIGLPLDVPCVADTLFEAYREVVFSRECVSQGPSCATAGGRSGSLKE